MKSYILSIQAENDLDGIFDYTLRTFGHSQLIKYQNQLIRCLNDLVDSNPNIRKYKVQNAEVLHIHCQHHYIFALRQNGEPLYIIAILHEKMDLKSKVVQPGICIKFSTTSPNCCNTGHVR